MADQPPSLPDWLRPVANLLRDAGRGAVLLLLLVMLALPAAFVFAFGLSPWIAAGLVALAALLLGYGLLASLTLIDAADGGAAPGWREDPISGVHSRAHVLSLINREGARAGRYATPSALAIVDIDNFKAVNARHGSDCGDALLRAVAAACQQTLRQPDLCGRFGGDEFIVFLPHTDPLGALDVAERMRERVERMDFSWEGEALKSRISIGVAALRPEHAGIDALIVEADEALGRAKLAGRNCVRASLKLLPGHADALRRQP